MSTRICLIVCLLFLALTGCAARNELRENQQKWAAQNATHYRFNLTIGCNCPWRSLMPLTIEIKDDQVVSMVDKNGQPAPTQYAETFDRAASIEKLFAILDQSIGSASEVKVAYEAVSGSPKSIVINPSKMVMDDEIGYYVTNLEVLK